MNFAHLRSFMRMTEQSLAASIRLPAACFISQFDFLRLCIFEPCIGKLGLVLQVDDVPFDTDSAVKPFRLEDRVSDFPEHR